MPRADDAAAVLVPVALAERAVVVRAAILDRLQLAAAVVDTDAETSLANDLGRAGRELVRRGDLDVRHLRELEIVEAGETFGKRCPLGLVQR
ncbi:MAG TPA: hypothetical protein VFJ11_05295, partial [Gaiellaceae bacterium]|nr:hypothetical protein [Gaiellaceae bacterium]